MVVFNVQQTVGISLFRRATATTAVAVRSQYESHGDFRWENTENYSGTCSDDYAQRPSHKAARATDGMYWGLLYVLGATVRTGGYCTYWGLLYVLGATVLGYVGDVSEMQRYARRMVMMMVTLVLVHAFPARVLYCATYRVLTITAIQHGHMCVNGSPALWGVC